MSMKKFIISTLAIVFGLALCAPSVFASGFNNDPRDLATVLVANDTQNPCTSGYGVGCWTPSTNAQPGDTIAVQIYYHNTSGQTAPNVSIGLSPQNSGATTTVSFSGRVSVGGVVAASGSGAVYNSSSQTLTFVSGSVKWYTSVGSTHALLANENTLFSNGLPIGNVPAGAQGVVVANFRVGNDTNGGGGSGGANCYINSFDPDDSSIDDGDSTSLRWNTTNCDHVDIVSNDQDFYNRSADGSVTVSPSDDTSYTLKAYDDNGNLDDSTTRTISVDNNNNNGSSCYIDQFRVTPSSITRGDDATLYWNTSGDIDYVSIDNLSGSESDDGSRSVSPYSTTTYTLRAYCNNGSTRTDNVTLYVDRSTQNSNPQAITTVATILSSAQARLNGIAVPNTNSGSTTAWFEWGIGNASGNRTNSRTISNSNASSDYSEFISVVPGGVYYYRAVVQNQNGIAYGEPVRFEIPRTTTTTPVIVRPTVVQTNTVVAQSAPSLLELRVQSNYDRMCVDGNIDYTITYRNISSKTLGDTVLRFTHPKEITYLSSSRGNYEVVDRTMTIDLGNVAPGEQGTVTVHAKVNNSAVQGNLTVATVSVVYTNTTTRAQEDAIAYSLITVSNDCPNVLGASTVGFGGFLPHTLLGWLLLILVILALIVLARTFYRKQEQPK